MGCRDNEDDTGSPSSEVPGILPGRLSFSLSEHEIDEPQNIVVLYFKVQIYPMAWESLETGASFQ